MAHISRINAEHVKSFGHLDVALGDFHILVGANAAGKSNFAQLFQFLANVARYDGEGAVALEGGFRHLSNHSAPADTDPAIEVTFANNDPFLILLQPGTHAKLARTTYRISINSSLEISDVLTLDLEVETHEKRVNPAFVILRRQGGETPLGVGGSPELARVLDLRSFQNLTESTVINPHQSLLRTPLGVLLFEPCRSTLERIAIYRIEPGALRGSARIAAEWDLEPSGANLAPVLLRLLSDEDRRESLLNILRDALPHVSNVNVQALGDRNLLLNLLERFSSPDWIPAPIASDGTLSMIALIVAIYFSDRPFIVVEEPERFIHPGLISRLMAMFRDASRHKQIIVTTHSPEIVRHADLSEILLISRDREGFSTVVRPEESAQVKALLQQDIGLGELYVDDLLGA